MSGDAAFLACDWGTTNLRGWVLDDWGRIVREREFPMLGVAQLAPGEGKLVKYEGKGLALYQDEHGELHAVSTVCPHAKCSVGWNSAEKSWDCPCHGSRFGIDGEVLTGPAREGLEVIEIQDLVQEEKH